MVADVNSFIGLLDILLPRLFDLLFRIFYSCARVSDSNSYSKLCSMLCIFMSFYITFLGNTQLNYID